RRDSGAAAGRGVAQRERTEGGELLAEEGPQEGPVGAGLDRARERAPRAIGAAHERLGRAAREDAPVVRERERRRVLAEPLGEKGRARPEAREVVRQPRPVENARVLEERRDPARGGHRDASVDG